jgi:mono/diheme cytochrome c family protein
MLPLCGAETAPAADTPELSRASLPGLGGRRVELAAPTGGATVLVFYSSECPISNGYSPTLNALIDSFPAKLVKWLGVCVDPDLADSEVETHARDFGLKFPVVRDRRGAFAHKLGAKVTPEAFVIDAEGHIRYHGRIDDQFVARRVRNAAPAQNDLKDAIAAILSRKAVEQPFVEAVGCPLPTIAARALAPTYSKDVASILQENCQECHRPGQVAPFPLLTYEQARKRAADIATVVDDHSMPPWKAMPHFGVAFKDARKLSEREIDTLVAWAETDAPEGDRALLPVPRSFSNDWQLGTPDLVLETGADFDVPASGEDIYRCFVVPAQLQKDRYVQAIEYRPGNRRVVHHILAYVDTSGKARERDAAEPGPGYTCFGGPGDPIHGDLGGWAPGMQPSRLPEGIGRSLPAKSDVIIQVHYHPSGKPEIDRTKLALFFSRVPVKQTLHWTAALNPELELPADKSNIEIQAQWEIPVDVVAYAVTPHMHLLGRDIQMSLKFPDGHVEPLIKIDNWDFNWQYSYYFEQPLDVPKGSVLQVVSHYDNTADNPRNPNRPPRLVKWGEATTDEMCVGFLAVTKKGQDLTRPGERDDLMETIRKQREELRGKYEKAARERAAKAKRQSSSATK